MATISISCPTCPCRRSKFLFFFWFELFFSFCVFGLKYPLSSIMKPESAGKKSRKLNKKGSVAAAADAVADAADDDGPQLFSSAVMASAAPAAVATPRSHVAATPAATPAPARALPAAETDGVEAKGKSASVAEMAQQVQHVAQEMAQLAQQTRSQIESQRLLLSHNSRPTAKGVSFLEVSE